MATAKLSALVTAIGSRLPESDGPVAADGELLARFLADRDEASFARLVRRHGPLVFGVCRRVTGDHHLAEDAFQAVFVVLATKADAVRPRSALPAWLYGVAYRTALRARMMADRRRRHERASGGRKPPVEPPEQGAFAPRSPEHDELVAILDAEIARLPDHLRLPVVLCELQGRSRHEAATELGIPEGTLSSRLAAARKALASRLRNRGVMLSAAALTAMLNRIASATAPRDLAAHAVAVALTPNLVPAPVAALSHGVLRIMLAQKLKAVAVALVLATAVVIASAVFAPAAPPTSEPPAAPGFATADPPKPVPAPNAEKPLPQGPNKLLVWRKGELVLIDPDGKNEKVVVPNKEGIHPIMFALSPDGSHIALVRPPSGDRQLGESSKARLFLREVGKDDPGTDLGEAGMVTWSADGTELAICQFTDAMNPKEVRATHSIYTLATKKRTPVNLPEDHLLTDWSRDGKFFLTTKVGEDRDNPFGGIWITKRDGTGGKAIADAKQAGVMGKFSPDGTRMLFMQMEPKEETADEKKARQDMGGRQRQYANKLVIVDVATGKATPVRDVPLNGELGGYCWSPDGKRIAYSWREVPQGDPKDVANQEFTTTLVTCDPDGGNQKTVATEKGGSGRITIAGVNWR